MSKGALSLCRFRRTSFLRCRNALTTADNYAPKEQALN